MLRVEAMMVGGCVFLLRGFFTRSRICEVSQHAMNQAEYFKISEKRKLPMRCPILDRCCRRAFTIYFFSYWQKEDGEVCVTDVLKRHRELPADFDATCVDVRGEMPSFSKADDYGHYENMCPEVNLFDTDHALPLAAGTASASGDWNDTQGLRRSVPRHFSECAEYCACVSQQARKRQFPREATSPKLRFSILERDNFTCQYCGRSQKDGAVLHVDHRTSVFDNGTKDPNNLITSCSICNFGKGKKSIDRPAGEPGA